MIAAVLVVLDSLLPAAWGHSESVDQYDGVGCCSIGGVLGGHEVLLTAYRQEVGWGSGPGLGGARLVSYALTWLPLATQRFQYTLPVWSSASPKWRIFL
jgi:hypothetical protein